MDIPNQRLNSSDRTTDEFQKGDIRAVNLQPVVREASEHMESPRGSESVCREIVGVGNSEPTSVPDRRERFGIMSEGIAGPFMSR
jgi:hypothetical protein